ncbi:hypothetical protein [Neolewinella sp.]|uniref:hypothetical protein n=1 Tax=Neolewinella sp. TaxID=2993543 RepID=UPI003B51B0DD
MLVYLILALLSGFAVRGEQASCGATATTISADHQVVMQPYEQPVGRPMPIVEAKTGPEREVEAESGSLPTSLPGGVHATGFLAGNATLFARPPTSTVRPLEFCATTLSKVILHQAFLI